MEINDERRAFYFRRLEEPVGHRPLLPVFAGLDGLFESRRFLLECIDECLALPGLWRSRRERWCNFGVGSGSESEQPDGSRQTDRLAAIDGFGSCHCWHGRNPNTREYCGESKEVKW